MKRQLFLSLLFVLGVIQALSQTTEVMFRTSVNNNSQLLRLNNKNTAPNKGIFASGDILYSSSDGYLRIIASDVLGSERIVYESNISMADSSRHDKFTTMGLETSYMNDYLPNSLRVEMYHASVSNLQIALTGLGLGKNASDYIITSRQVQNTTLLINPGTPANFRGGKIIYPNIFIKRNKKKGKSDTP